MPVSRSDGQIEERRNLSSTSISVTHRSFQKSASPQVQSEQNSGTLTDQSSSFESSVSTSARKHGSFSRKEVRFREDVVPSREISLRNHHLETDGEFIKETSAFRAAMNYDDDDDDDDDNDTRDNSGEQRVYHQAQNGVEEVAYAQTRHITPAHYEDELGRKTGFNVKLQSPSKQRGESIIKAQLRMERTEYIYDDRASVDVKR